MQLKLSCYCCGNEDFEHTEIEGLLEIEGRSYLLQEEIKNNEIICKKCGLQDYIQNLPIKFS